MRVTFADWVSDGEVDVVIGIIHEFGEIVDQDRKLRTVTVVPNWDEVDMLKEFLGVWETDDALSWTEAD